MQQERQPQQHPQQQPQLAPAGDTSSSVQSSPVRILQFVPEALPTFRVDVATLFGKYLPRHGVQCDVVGMPSQAVAAQQGFNRASRPSYHGSRLRRELAYGWLCLRMLLSARRGEYAAVQVRDMVTIGLLALCVARLKGIPFYYWVSYLMSEGRVERAEANLARRRTFRNYLVLLKGRAEEALLYKCVLPAADHVFVQSDAMLHYVRDRGIPAERMTPVPMGVDTELLEDRTLAPRRLPGWEHVPLIAYLGTLDKARNLERVVDALVLLRAQHPTARLLMIGNSATSSDEIELLEYAKQCGVGDAMLITGWLPSIEAWQLLAAADAAVSYIPRGRLYDVSSPTKLLEYLALGMPAVGNDIPDQQIVLQSSEAGWLTASEPAAMAEALGRILRDPEAARRRAGRGPAFIEAERSYRTIAARVAARYRALAAK
ncbi:glycosyltransferase [Pseudoduganella dura]|nr:glycosyltransferase [Pseudoduganella dura]